MRLYLGILGALLGSSRLLTGFLALLILLPAILGWAGVYDPNLLVSVLLVQNGSIWFLWFIGLRLGSSTRVLWAPDTLQLLPGNRRRLLTVSTLLGLSVWGLVVWSYTVSGVDPEGFLPYQRWIPLWSYGALGLGFLGGVNALDSCASTREQWIQSIKWIWPMLAMVFLMIGGPLQAWLNMSLFDTLPGVTPLALACLLLGPLTWGFFLSRRPDDREPVVTIRRNWEEQLRIGGPQAAWGLPFFVKHWHSRAKPRLEFMVLSPQLLTIWIAFGIWTLVSVVIFAVFLILGKPEQFVVFMKMPILVWALFASIQPINTPPLVAQRMGYGLLLPGAVRKTDLPKWLFSRMMLHWLSALVAMAIPLAAFALWAGMGLKHIAIFGVVWILCMCAVATMAFWRSPKWPRHKAIDSVMLLLGFAVMMGLVVAVSVDFTQFVSVTEFLVFCLATLSLSAWFYRQGLKRWANMEYGD